MATTTPGGGGSYSEGNAFTALSELQNLRNYLDSGKISVSQFLQQGKALATFIESEAFRLGGGGSSSAKVGQKLWSSFMNGNTGFTNNTPGQRGIVTNLPEQYQQKLREELIPKNITGEERQTLIDQLPADIGFDTDRFAIEKEGVRQAMQQKKVAEEQKTGRSTQLKDLASFLRGEEDRKFGLMQPDIAEQANANGMYSGTGYSEALARERAKLAGDTSALLAAQGLSDRDQDIQALATIMGTRQDFQSSALQRQFGLSDENRNHYRAKELAELTREGAKKRSGGGGLLGTGGGAVIGALLAGIPSGGMGAGMGAQIGASIGGGAGNAYDAYQR